MARPYGPSERLRSIAGGALIGLGLHILFGNLDRGAVQVRQLFGTTAGDALGAMPDNRSGGLAAVQAYALDQPGVPAGSRPAIISSGRCFWLWSERFCCRTLSRIKIKASPAPSNYFQNTIFK